MTAIQEAIQRIKAAGFSHIKVELEADLHREDGSCGGCNGDGNIDCEDCDGSGAIDTGETVGRYGTTVYAECSECDGEGYAECGYCDGNGSAAFSDEDYCENYILDNVPNDARAALDFSRFYHDGSVDSEFTFTLPIEKAEAIPEFLKAFNALADEIGNGIGIDGAGMHISVLPEGCDGVYPSRTYMDDEKLENFTTEVTKLLPALYFLASADHHSRGLNYRYPRISNSKYDCDMDAVGICTHDGTAIEYRVFETCYERPKAIFEFIEVIANTLKFYADPTLKVPELGLQFDFNDDGYNVARFYDNADNLRALNATVKHLKPKEKSYKRLKQERGVNYTIKSLTEKERGRIAQLRAEYREYAAHRRQLASRPLSDSERRDVDWLVLERDMTVDEATRHVRRSVENIETMGEFIRRNLRRWRNTEVTLRV